MAYAALIDNRDDYLQT